MKNIKLSVIIVNYNGGAHLKSAIDSLIKLRIPYEVIIYDNNSTDESLNTVENNEPIIKIFGSTNIGFGRANNEAAKIARGEYLLLLNNDAALIDDISTLIEDNLISDNCIASLKMIGENNIQRPSYGIFPNKIKHIFFPSSIYCTDRHLKSSSEESVTVDWVEGSFMLIKKTRWEQLGGFDENVFMYGEDLILCYENAIKGGENIIFLKYIYFHKGGFNDSKKGNIYIGFYNLIKKYPAWLRYQLKLTILAAITIKLIISAAKGKITEASSYLKSCMEITLK
jgi:GT2 family glycosyltransferase